MKYLVLLLALSLAGCADYKDLNQMIDSGNTNRLKVFGEALAKCGDNQACSGMLGMAFASGMGQQQFIKPQTALDWAVAMSPYANTLLEAYKIYEGGVGSGMGGITVSDSTGVSISGVGVEMTSTGDGGVTGTFTPSQSMSWANNNKNYNLGADTSSGGTVTDTGVVDLAEPVVTGGTVTTPDVITP